MPLVTCPDCGSKVSANAPMCPKCGCPVADGRVVTVRQAGGITCPYCGANRVERVRGLHGAGELLLGFWLLLLGIIPGVIYYAYKESIPFCTGCGRRVKG